MEAKTLVLSLLSNEGYGHWYWDVWSGEVEWCPRVYEIFSVSSFDNRIESFHKLIHPQDLEYSFKQIPARVRHGSDISSFLRVRGDDGCYRRVYNAGRIATDRRGKLKSITGYVRLSRADESAAAEAEFAQSNDPTLHRGYDYAQLKSKISAAVETNEARDLAQAEKGYLEFILLRTNDPPEARRLTNRLYERFGSFPGVVTADDSDLLKVEGMGQQQLAVFQIIRMASASMLRPRNKPLSFDDVDNLVFYLRSVQGYKDKEQFRVIFLNGANFITHDEVMSEGTSNFAPVFVTEVIKRALDLRSHKIVLVHNHPSGDPRPSLADIETTQRLVKAARAVEISVVDHIVVGSFGHVSFRSLGLIEAG